MSTSSADLLQVAADVGTRGGFVVAGPPGGRRNQTVYWSATAGNNRTRGGFLVVPVVDGSVHLHYQAGTQLIASLVGYVTGTGAADSAAGLVVPVPPAALPQVRVPAGTGSDVTVVPPDGLAEVPAKRAGAILLGIVATGGTVVHAPGSAAPKTPVPTAAKGASVAITTLVATVNGAIRVDSQSGATVALTPQAIVLTG